MFKLFVEWYKRRFSDPHVVSLIVVLVFLFLIIYFFNKILLPVFIAIVLSYLLDTPVNFLYRKGIPRTFAVIIVLLIFLLVVLACFMILVPLVWQQSISLITNIPNMLNFANKFLTSLPEHYPELIDVGLFDSIIQGITSRVVQTGNSLLQFSIVSLFGLVSVAINAVLVPIMMFFFLKDKAKIWGYCSRILPKNRGVLNKVAAEMDTQIANYIVGNVLHILILGISVYIPFWFFGLDYGLLLAVIVGLSVLIPYIGIIISSIPVILIALFQWGISPEFGYLIFFYVLIQALDGNLLVPCLFSEKLNLHPLVIILAVIVFGGLWGFWGIFFAIPLATLVKAIINAWPNPDEINSFDKVKAD
ncbi:MULTISPECIES: AI-2E family transporter [unclassified Gilliamella]|uniref:AI-2E family transporter n=1 Tax=unclassified Gilliamella TaxID=2685620 RepID=UPI00226A40B3|nr:MULTISPECIES: AI-2E family transporter [unclassified Gilliamella]MCX8574484.1 AI-2E family transporter [Gilliamella sp. B3831]MCX8576715.1 AI-2E family transporter [Gilliamella sp. B3815]MCX8578487.1 AI-2E family transporter [Gilliamella sp. B2717]MCX8587360.1 AI-2E family transporter [Gilliamella sp. B3801]MCX8589303.1 AI-2E family transporter [Gilliamella sp. B3812]